MKNRDKKELRNKNDKNSLNTFKIRTFKEIYENRNLTYWTPYRGVRLTNVTPSLHLTCILQNSEFKRWVKSKFQIRFTINLMTQSILTIGYANLSIQEFLETLKKNNVQAVIDTRSIPHSRYHVNYNRKRLVDYLKGYGIGYRFMGNYLGGLPKDENLKTNGTPDYNKIRKSLNYQKGLDFLEKGLEFNCRMVLLCACADYTKCHRYNLIGADLQRMGYNVMHIQKDGSVIDQKRLF